MSVRRPLQLVLVAVAVLIFATGDLSACPLCSDTLGQDEAGDPSQMARGYFWSILLMIAMPFTVGGTVGALLLREIRRRAAAGADDREAADVDL